MGHRETPGVFLLPFPPFLSEKWTLGILLIFPLAWSCIARTIKGLENISLAGSEQPVNQALRKRLRLENSNKAHLHYKARPYLKKKKVRNAIGLEPAC